MNSRRPVGIWLAAAYLFVISFPGLVLLATLAATARNHITVNSGFWLFYSFARAGLLLTAAVILLREIKMVLWLLALDFCLSLGQEISHWQEHSAIHLAIKLAVYLYIWNYFSTGVVRSSEG